MSLSRKAINFDLSTNELKKHFPNTAEAYNQIKSFMLKNGFEHRQYSGYASIEPMDNDDIASLARRISKNFPWLSPCVQAFDVTDIGEQYSLKHIFESKLHEQDLNPKMASKEKQMESMQERVKKSCSAIKAKDSAVKGNDWER